MGRCAKVGIRPPKGSTKVSSGNKNGFQRAIKITSLTIWVEKTPLGGDHPSSRRVFQRPVRSAVKLPELYHIRKALEHYIYHNIITYHRKMRLNKLLYIYLVVWIPKYPQKLLYFQLRKYFEALL
jgi:hypothetical protein